MDRGKAFWMKTYGKSSRMVPAAWSPDNRKQAFDSSASANSSNPSVCVEPTETRKKSTVSSRRMRTATKRSAGSLKENCAVSPSKEPSRSSNLVSRQGGLLRRDVQQASETSSSNSAMSASCSEPKESSKRKGTFVSSRRVRTAKRKAMVSLKENGSSDSSSPQKKKLASVAPPPPGRFVTKRRGAATKACALLPLHNLDSSDEFVLGGKHIAQKTRRRQARLLSISPESAVNDAVNSNRRSTIRRVCQQSSISEAEDQTLGPYRREPLFCSTPSLNPVGKRPGVPAASPPVSPLDLGSSLEELVPSGDPFAPPLSAPLREPGSECKPLPIITEAPDMDKMPSVILLSPVGLDHGSDSVSSDGSCEKSDDGEEFVSVSGGSKWLIDSLKKMCLSKRCQVQLERVDKQTTIPLHPQTPYSSCLGYSSSALCPQTTEDPQMESGQTSNHSGRLCPAPPCHVTDYSESLVEGQTVYPSELVTDSFHLILSENSQSAAQSNSSGHNPSVTDVHINSLALSSVACNQSVDGVQSTHQVDHQIESVTDAWPGDNSAYIDQQQICKQMPDEAAMIIATRKEECLAKKCTVPLKRLASTRCTGAKQLEEETHMAPTDDLSSDSTHGENTGHPDPKRHSIHSERSARKNGATDSEDMTSDVKECVENDERHPKMMVPRATKEKRRSVSRDRPGTARKVFVSGLSVSRWKDKGNASTHRSQNQHALRGGSKAGDCSITELLSGHHNEPTVVNKGLLQDSGMVFSTPVKALPSNLDLSSLLAKLTPETHTWSRLKACLSVYRKIKVGLTPKNLLISALATPGRAGLVDGSMDLFDMPVKTPLSKRLQSQLQNSSAFLNTCEDEYELSDAEKVYAECNQQGALCWEEAILPDRLKKCKKIGEGTFGEVFSTVDASGDAVALKIIPIEGNEKVNGEKQKTFGDILHEIIISKELSSLKAKQHNQTHGFIGLHGLHCVKGSYPAIMLKAWDAFARQKGSENDRPDFFEEEQLFIILEFEFGGSDLENSNGKLSSLAVAKTILHQVTAALAVAEQELRFEHRDLHWGNILVKTTKEKSASFLLNGTNHTLDTKGVLVRIIDYSLSRLEIDGLTVSCDISEDEGLFMGQGDYQFEVYRLMREENSNKWGDYQPHSNILWLHYVCDKLLTMKYRGAGGRSKATREELQQIHKNLLQYRSATEALQSGMFLH